jgi:hypothetical protein
VDTITIPTLVERLRRCNRAQLVAIVAITTPAMAAAGNPYHGRITQVTTATGLVNFTAAGGAAKHAGRRNEPPPRRSWGERLPGCPLATRTDSAGMVWHYLTFNIHQRTDTYFETDTLNRVPSSRLRRFMRQHETGRGRVKDFRLDRVAELRISGQVWAVLPLWPLLQQFLKGARL